MRNKEFLNAHYMQNISIDDLARITQLSRAYLMRSFRHCVGMPPYAYLIQLRIKKAKQLLPEKYRLPKWRMRPVFATRVT
jgi:AraC-like DNA-binding protein